MKSQADFKFFFSKTGFHDCFGYHFWTFVICKDLLSWQIFVQNRGISHLPSIAIETGNSNLCIYIWLCICSKNEYIYATEIHIFNEFNFLFQGQILVQKVWRASKSCVFFLFSNVSISIGISTCLFNQILNQINWKTKTQNTVFLKSLTFGAISRLYFNYL